MTEACSEKVMLSPQQLERLHIAVESCLASEKATGVPAELSIAQWAVESGWGEDSPGNNCFGIKAYAGCYGVQSLPTKEFIKGVATTVMQEFATFPDLASCFTKHATLISEGAAYAAVWDAYQKMKVVTALVEGVAPIYSTAPNYAGLLLKVIAMQAVAEALAKVRTN